ncbi:Aklavinone 12-hydroxylase RdmE [Janthinobacterium sp. AD80]|nr:Aklavinone 12-hydroxylase RdmE [Janthinobacterium sp. AD80]
MYGNLAMELGQLTRSGAILGADAALPPAAHPRDWAGQPGTRAPHVWVRHRGNSVSSIDLLTEDFVLLTADPRWCAAAAHLQLKTLLVGADVIFPAEQPFRDSFGTGDDGAVIVRPDGIIAWRSAPAAIPEAMLLRTVMEKIALPHG